MKREKYQLHLKFGDEIKIVNVEWCSNETDNIVKIQMNLNGENIELTDGCTEMVLIKLSELLKDKYEIHSCFTCRYGNFCPVGDMDNEIFCINDFEPKCKEDLYFVTEDADERVKRSRTLFYNCPDFKLCSKGYFSYK